MHLVFNAPGDPDPDRMLVDWRAYASRALNCVDRRPVWWARDGSTRPLKSTAARLNAIRYVRDQIGPLALWLLTGR